MNHTLWTCSFATTINKNDFADKNSTVDVGLECWRWASWIGENNIRTANQRTGHRSLFCVSWVRSTSVSDCEHKYRCIQVCAGETQTIEMIIIGYTAAAAARWTEHWNTASCDRPSSLLSPALFNLKFAAFFLGSELKNQNERAWPILLGDMAHGATLQRYTSIR